MVPDPEPAYLAIISDRMNDHQLSCLHGEPDCTVGVSPEWVRDSISLGYSVDPEDYVLWNCEGKGGGRVETSSYPAHPSQIQGKNDPPPLDKLKKRQKLPSGLATSYAPPVFKTFMYVIS